MSKPITTTLNCIREHSPCEDGWKELLAHLGKTKADDEPLPLTVILDSNGLDDCLWCLRAVDGYEREVRLFAVWCARKVQHLMTDERSLKALDVAEAYANGEATAEQLDAARDAARAASDAAWTARAYSRADAKHAWDTCEAAWAALVIARADAWDTCEAAWAARAYSWNALLAAQTTKLRGLLETGEWDD